VWHDDRVLDVACGTGIVARTVASVVGPTGAVVGTDLNEAMLDEAAQHIPAGVGIERRQGDAQDLGGSSRLLTAQGSIVAITSAHIA
jgi:ubiquinone/menaquinone biosynthesis C-methylase UbiE